MDANMSGISVIIFSVLGVAVAVGPDATSWWTGWVAPAILISIIATVFVGGKWVGGVNSNLKSLNTNVGEVKTTLSDFMKEVRGEMDQIFERLPSPPGTNISEELEADAWADPLAPEPVRESA